MLFLVLAKSSEWRGIEGRGERGWKGVTEIYMFSFSFFQLETSWATLEFMVTPHGKDTSKEGTYILGGVEDVLTQLEDSQVVVGTIKGSRYIGPVRSV